MFVIIGHILEIFEQENASASRGGRRFYDPDVFSFTSLVIYKRLSEFLHLLWELVCLGQVVEFPISMFDPLAIEICQQSVFSCQLARVYKMVDLLVLHQLLIQYRAFLQQVLTRPDQRAITQIDGAFGDGLDQVGI